MQVMLGLKRIIAAWNAKYGGGGASATMSLVGTADGDTTSGVLTLVLKQDQDVEHMKWLLLFLQLFLVLQILLIGELELLMAQLTTNYKVMVLF